jgi:membrane fusion protein (multidrug efflux system)
VFLAIAIVAVAMMLGWPWLAERWSHVAINDARIAAKLISVSSEVSGRVTTVSVIAGDRVEKGQLLASIDEEQTLLELQALDAQITGIEAQQEQLRSQQAMILTQVTAKLAAARTEITGAQANHRASEAVLQNARSRFERISSLVKSNVSSAQSLEEAQAALSMAEQQEQATAAGIETATANLAVIRSEEAQIAVLDRQIAALDAQKAALAAERAQKRIDLARRKIHAEFDGVVDSAFVDAGEYVSPGTRLLIYHDPNTIWVDANVKETDFGRVKMGSP